jgi:membrane-bound metal-dependent hydrolase YbcI (DUF457 family)
LSFIGHAIVPFAAWAIARAPLACLLAALFFAYLPDIDILYGLATTGNVYSVHRTVTHSLALALIPVALYLLTRRIEFAWGTFGAVSHPLIDLITSRIMLFWPLSDIHYSIGGSKDYYLASEAAFAAIFLAVFIWFLYARRKNK